MRKAKWGGKKEAMYPLTATEKSEKSSLLVLEMEGSKPQSRWKMGHVAESP